jgi:acyl carrier protein
MSFEPKITTFINQLALEGDTKVDGETSLLDSGIIDSTGILELVSFLEREFGIQVQDEEIVPENFENVRSIAAFVERKRSAAA